MMDALARQITEFITSGPDNDAEATLERLALTLFDRQYRAIAPYRRLCDSNGMTPGKVQRWQDIPAVPASAFKAFELSCAPIQDTVAVFYSSGTTGAGTSRHFFDRDGLSLYETSLQSGFSAELCDCPSRLWAMMPSPKAAPNSSLSHMLEALRAERFYWDADTELTHAFGDLSEPITLFGTAFAFLQLFDGTAQRWRLPSGSVVIETGGYKGRTREAPREELYGLFQTRLGVPLSHCYSEYGMSEMASQFYGHGLDPTKRGPHWLRTRAIDPETGEDAPPGTPGLLRHYDLANWNSVLALQTQDMGTITPAGFVLNGRAPQAEVRGCSLTVEELWTSRQHS